MKTSKLSGTKELVCVNSNPEKSKYWKWAPAGGCDEVVVVDINTTSVLCYKCTSRSAKG